MISVETMNPKIAVIGLGPMGRAMVRAYLKHGYGVTVWNRTVERAQRMVAEGAQHAARVDDALRSAEIVVLSLTDYEAMYDILAQSGEALNGCVIVNLSSDTPERTREASKWLAARGASLLVGGVMVPEHLVGKEPAYVFYSGPRAVFDRWAETLRVIGRADFVGTDPALAQLFYQAQLDIFLTSLSAYLHATALLASAGVSAKTFLPYAVDNFNSLSLYLDEAAGEIDERRYPGETASLAMMGATAHHIVATSRAAGIDVDLPSAVQKHYDSAIAAGFGHLGWTALIERIRRPDATTVLLAKQPRN